MPLAARAAKAGRCCRGCVPALSPAIAACSRRCHTVMLCVSLCAFVWVFVQTTAVPAVVFVLLACIISIALVMVSLESCVRLVDGSLDVLSKLLWVEWWNVLP